MSGHTPGPWRYEDVPSAGLEIMGPVHLVDAVELPKGIPAKPINIFGLASPQNVLLSYERWVQFEPKGWHEMQVANARLIAAAPDLLEALTRIVKLRKPCSYPTQTDQETHCEETCRWCKARAAIAKAEGK
jgi:hypothetical protein